ncbi:hypothetical protein HPB50_014185 [Hyalomma asiaticum]|uniref:Uncharacterized protein n=1 Tax=Hyalomma asiaticum TaxID=266040 RepID=A0ACB7RPX1_HYAAI|nr:hypothetical protein HPB50_014185 [Hyalomma asiaticum]
MGDSHDDVARSVMEEGLRGWMEASPETPVESYSSTELRDRMHCLFFALDNSFTWARSSERRELSGWRKYGGRCLRDDRVAYAKPGTGGNEVGIGHVFYGLRPWTDLCKAPLAFATADLDHTGLQNGGHAFRHPTASRIARTTLRN